MITAEETSYINTHAYMPEHITSYVEAISGAEPFLLKTFLCYKKDSTIIFIGYPLGEPFEEKKMKKTLDKATKEFKPEEISLIAPSIKILRDIVCEERASDTCFRLDMSALVIPQKVRNMLNRSSKALNIECCHAFGDEHLQLTAEFLDSHKVGKDTEYIFDKLPGYVSSAGTALVINARDRDGRLVAFDVAEFAPKDYVFYMFNFASRKYYVPGASDGLLYTLITSARGKGKKFINLGLGINDGIRFFKKKWGGAPFSTYEFCRYAIKGKAGMELLLGKL